MAVEPSIWGMALASGGSARQGLSATSCGPFSLGFCVMRAVRPMVQPRFDAGKRPRQAMSRLEDIAARLAAALDTLEATALPLAEARARAARDAATIAGLNAERESLLARIAELEDETRSLAGITEEVETRLDGAIEEIRSALGR